MHLCFVLANNSGYLWVTYSLFFLGNNQLTVFIANQTYCTSNIVKKKVWVHVILLDSDEITHQLK